MNKPVPVIMYHSIGIPNKQWKWNYLTCPYKIFENQLQWLKKFNFKTISLEELYGYIFENKRIPSKSIVLTFDDGYVDNYIFAYSLLKKYNMKGTIFVNPDFVDRRNIKRTRIDQIKENNISKLEITGFLSWTEMEEMENSGVIDIQSHALTHTWYPISDQVIDFRHPDDKYIWLTWNYYPEKKPFLQVDNPQLVKLGQPVYKYEKSLSSKRFFPDETLDIKMIEFIQKNGKEAFFKNKNWNSILFNKFEQIKKTLESDNSHYETDKEYLSRIEYELLLSKRTIEERLNKKVEFLCWPGGSATDKGVIIARKLGYKMTTAARDIPKLRKKIKNNPKLKIDRVTRIGPSLFWDGKENSDSKSIYAKGLLFILKIQIFRLTYPVKFVIKLFLKLIDIYYRRTII